MRADLTDGNVPAEALLKQAGGIGLPFLAVFCGDNPLEPRVLDSYNVLNPGDYKTKLRAILADCSTPTRLQTAQKD